MTDTAFALLYGAPHLPPRPDSVTVVEYDIRRMTVRVDGQDWWVVLRSVDGIEVEIPGDLIRDAHPIDRPSRCEYVADGAWGGCEALVDPNGPDDGRCDIHETTRRGDLR
jgi:hypothetical protein